MIERKKHHVEKQKLSDKFQQPFEVSSLKDTISIFNGKRQKAKKSHSVGSSKKRKK